jgi:TPR repeat protein
MLDQGRGVDKDQTEAVNWYRKAADQGNAQAQNNLGVSYENGWGVAQDYAEALSWFLKAALQGNVAAQRYAAVLYWDGKGTAQNYEESIRWFGKAADQGDAFSKDRLGDAYRQGLGVHQDFAKAIDWFCAAAADGLAHGMNSCGYGLLIGGPGVASDPVEALKWLTLAVERSEPGEVHQRAIVNLNHARANATPQQVDDAERRAEELRAKWRTNTTPASNTRF